MSVGHGTLVGRTVEAFPRPVYHLYDRASREGNDGRRHIEGNFVLEKRRLNLLPAGLVIRQVIDERQKGHEAGSRDNPN